MAFFPKQEKSQICPLLNNTIMLFEGMSRDDMRVARYGDEQLHGREMEKSLFCRTSATRGSMKPEEMVRDVDVLPPPHGRDGGGIRLMTNKRIERKVKPWIHYQIFRPAKPITLQSDKRGVTGVKKLIKVERGNDERPIVLISNFEVFVDLPSDRKGANLSRNFEVIDEV